MTFASLVDLFLDIINGLVPVIFAITVVYIFWHIIKAWIIGGGDPQSIETGKKTVLVGIIALVVMLGVWSIVAILKSSLSL